MWRFVEKKLKLDEYLLFFERKNVTLPTENNIDKQSFKLNNR